MNRTVTCYLSPIKALPLRPGKVSRPAVTVGGRTVVFPVEIESGHYLEFHGGDDCKLYSPKGDFLGEVRPEGEVPVLAAGENVVTCRGAEAGPRPRARVTVITQDEALLCP